jgi:hypothetical protein
VAVRFATSVLVPRAVEVAMRAGPGRFAAPFVEDRVVAVPAFLALFRARVLLAPLLLAVLVLDPLFFAVPARADPFRAAAGRLVAVFRAVLLVPRPPLTARVAPGVRVREAERAVLRLAMTRPLSGEP